MPRGPKPLKTKLKKTEFYCVGCRKRVHGDDLYVKNVKNYKVGKVPMLKGTCHKCEGTVNKFIKKSEAKKW